MRLHYRGISFCFARWWLSSARGVQLRRRVERLCTPREPLFLHQYLFNLAVHSVCLIMMRSAISRSHWTSNKSTLLWCIWKLWTEVSKWHSLLRSEKNYRRKWTLNTNTIIRLCKSTIGSFLAYKSCRCLSTQRLHISVQKQECSPEPFLGRNFLMV